MHLIRKNQVNIYDIPIATITDEYNKTLDLMRELDLEIAGEFIYMAALLIHIKSRLLLPRSLEGEEEDPRQELVDRLHPVQLEAAVKQNAGVAGEGRGVAADRGDAMQIGLGQFLGLGAGALAGRVDDGAVEPLEFARQQGAAEEVARLGRHALEIRRVAPAGIERLKRLGLAFDGVDFGPLPCPTPDGVMR